MSRQNTSNTSITVTEGARTRGRLRRKFVAGLAVAAITVSGALTSSVAQAPRAEAAPRDITCSSAAPKMSMEGTVWFDKSNDQVAQKDEVKVPDVVLHVYEHKPKPNHVSTKVAEVTTNESGKFTVPNVKGGTRYSVEIFSKLPSGFSAERTTQMVDITAGKCKVGVDFPLSYDARKGEAIDIPSTDKALTSLQWAVDRELFTIGDDKLFHPETRVKRGEGASFIYRAMVPNPPPAPDYTPFGDAPQDDEHFPAVAWLVANNGVSGTGSSPTFSFKGEFNRRDVAMILFRLGQKTAYEAPTTIQFEDIPVGSTYFTATAWMKAKGFSSGYADGTFGANRTITRKELAIMVYRFHEQFKGKI